MSASDTPTAQSPGRSIHDILSGDRVPPPPPLLERCWQDLGNADIPTGRYYDPAFQRLEQQRLWNRSWQWACREEHLQDVGDSWVYDISHYSVIVVRSAEDRIEAFANSCTHRGTRLLAGEGSRYTRGFSCPFHGWSWHLDGRIDNIPGRWDFPQACDASHGLRPVRCDTWGGFVFINLDPEAPPLTDYLEVLPAHFAHFPLEQRRIRVHVEKALPANWKAAQEAFMEAYHNFQTHDSPNGGNTQYDLFGDHVSRFIHNVGTYCPESLADYPGDKWRRPPLTEEEQLLGLSVLGHGLTELPPGETARSAVAADLRQRLGEQWGVDLSSASDCEMLDSIEYHLFPNMFFFAGINIPMVYRFRPDGDNVDRCLFDVMVLEPHPEGEPFPEPPEVVRLDVEQSYTEVPALAWLAPVYDQDTDNLAMQQQGFKAGGKSGITLGNYQECRIRRVHRTLEKFLGIAEGEA